MSDKQASPDQSREASYPAEGNGGTAGAATAVDERPGDSPDAGSQDQGPGRRLRDRLRHAPRGARWAATAAAAVLLVLLIGLGGFLLGRGTADDGGRPGDGPHRGFPGFGGGHDGDRGGDFDGDFDGAGPIGGGGAAQGTSAQTWYVVPAPAASADTLG